MTPRGKFESRIVIFSYISLLASFKCFGMSNSDVIFMMFMFMPLIYLSRIFTDIRDTLRKRQ